VRVFSFEWQILTPIPTSGWNLVEAFFSPKLVGHFQKQKTFYWIA
jgi:hypothetical protein